MSNDKKHNELDQFFRSRLSKTDMNSDWNMPSDSVFEGAMDAIADDRKKRRVWWWFVLFGLLTIILGYVLWSQVQIQELASKVDRLEDQIESQPKEEHEEQTAISKEDVMVEINSDKMVEEMSKDQPIQAIPQNGFAKPFKMSESVVRSENKFEVSSEPVVELEITKEEGLSGNQVIDPVINEEDQTAVPVVLPSQEEPDSTSSFTDKKNDIVIPADTTTPEKWTRYVGVFAGANWTSLSMTAAVPLPDNLTEYDNWYPGYQMGLRFGSSIGKSQFLLQSRFLFSTSRNQSVFRDEATYNSAEEVVVNGNTEYHTNYNFDSPIGPFSESIRFAPEGQAQHNDLMNSKMEVENEFKTWSLRLGAAYQLPTNSQWGLNFNAGLGFNYITEMSQTFDFSLENNTLLLHQFSGVVNDLASLNQYYTSAYAGIEVHRKLGPMIIGLNSGFERSLSSIRAVDPVMKVKTQMSTVSTSFTVRWEL